jgi:hypothetical protein
LQAAVPADSLRRVVSQVFARPEYEWIERRHVLAWLQAQWRHLNDWMGRLSEQHPLGFNIVLGLSALALLVLLVHIGYVIMRIVQPAMRTGAGGGASAVIGGRIMDAAAHLALAEELARAGRYTDALAHRFMAVLLELDRRQALRFHASKTPAEYISEVRLDDSGRASFTTLVAALYRHLFGAVPCDETAYAAFGTAAQELARGPRVVPA